MLCADLMQRTYSSPFLSKATLPQRCCKFVSSPTSNLHTILCCNLMCPHICCNLTMHVNQHSPWRIDIMLKPQCNRHSNLLTTVALCQGCVNLWTRRHWSRTTFFIAITKCTSMKTTPGISMLCGNPNAANEVTRYLKLHSKMLETCQLARA